MGKLNLSDIDIPIDLGDVEKVKAAVKKEAPKLKAGFRQIEKDVEKAVRAAYDWLAEQEPEKTDE